MAFVRWIIVAVVFVALLYLSLQNSERTTLRFFHVAQWDAPLVVVVFIAFACGVAAGLLAGAIRSARLKRQVNRLRREQRAGANGPAHGAADASLVAPATGTVGYPRADRVIDGL
ncbi:MAG: LapA family protein [Burkholderiales bacterium]|nr:LapA family protein [Burkholderiales bacterium]